MNDFKLIAQAQINESTYVNKYRDEETGLTVVLADVEGPLMNGYFSVATEAHDDDGLPHTLEHIVLQGSERYPYKGALYLIANRCLAYGVNGFSDVDGTYYTISNVGSDGFLVLMPIYLEHILYPTCTVSQYAIQSVVFNQLRVLFQDAVFSTEIHHITGEGDDDGLMYSEIKGMENTAYWITRMALYRAVYPNSAYKSMYGGVLHNIRTSTTIDKVRAYHKKFYRPENLTVIITGKIPPERVFEALKPLKEKIKKKPKKDVFERPWKTPVEGIVESQDIKILYPSSGEDSGLVMIGYMGPNCITDYSEIKALTILQRYLTSTTASPLQRDMVEIVDPYASTVHGGSCLYVQSLLWFKFVDVPITKIEEVLSKFQKVVSNVANEEKIDMQRMQSIIDKEYLEDLVALENNPHSALSDILLDDHLYGIQEDDVSWYSLPNQDNYSQI